MDYTPSKQCPRCLETTTNNSHITNAFCPHCGFHSEIGMNFDRFLHQVLKKQREQNAMLNIVVYEKPTDNPNRTVARAWWVTGNATQPDPELLITGTTQEVMDFLHSTHLHFLERAPQDEKQILGTFL